MVNRPLVVEMPIPLFLVLEELASERGVRPAALALELIRPHLASPRPRRQRLRLLPLPEDEASDA